MTLADDHMITMRRARRDREARDYRMVFWIAFPFFLLFTAASRLDPRRLWAPPRVAEPRRSVFREAWTETQNTIPFVFMN
jgi:hypothetical protein